MAELRVAGISFRARAFSSPQFTRPSITAVVTSAVWLYRSRAAVGSAE